MKIAHVNYLPNYFPGVERKLMFQAEVAFSQDYRMDFFILNPSVERIEKNIYYKKIQFKSNILKSIEQKLFRYKIIESLVPFEDYDYIILRYPLALGFGFKPFYKKWGQKIITEHHSIEENELQYRFNSKILSKICSFLESKNKNYIFKKTAGMIGVTNEIILSNHKSLNRKVVISNGFKVSSVQKAKRPIYIDEFRMVFVASSLSPWHGMDKVVKAAEKYSGPHMINIQIIGRIDSPEDLLMFKNISNKWVKFELLGMKNKEELDSIYSDIHLGISSLNLSCLGMEEACVLKTREYISRGIPFIYGYKDSDLRGDENFAYRIDSHLGEVNFNSIINFYLNLIKNNNYQDEMQNFAMNKIDMKIKVEHMIDFVSKISNMD